MAWDSALFEETSQPGSFRKLLAFISPQTQRTGRTGENQSRPQDGQEECHQPIAKSSCMAIANIDQGPVVALRSGCGRVLRA